MMRKDSGDPYSVVLSYGSLQTRGNALEVRGEHAQLEAWAHRAGSAWPCSQLARCRRGVIAVLDRASGDLVDLAGAPDDMGADELTAWIDDNLAGTPFAHLARTVAEVGENV